MTISNPASSTPEPLRPRRRLRKRWIILVVLCGAILFGGWLIFREETVAVLRLPDGRRFTIHRITYGTEHHWGSRAALTPVETWLNQWLARIGRNITAYTIAGTSIRTTDNCTCFWHSFDWSQRDLETTPKTLVLIDENGWKTSIDLGQLAPTAPAGTVPMASIGNLAVPLITDSNRVQLELWNEKGSRLAATQVDCRAPAALKQAWKAAPFPVTESAGNLRVTLRSLHAKWADAYSSQPFLGDALEITPELLVDMDGVATTDWKPMAGGTPFLEYPPLNSTIESPYGTWAPIPHCTVSPHESAWKVSLPLLCHNPDAVSPTDGVRFQQRALDNVEQPAAESMPVKAGESKVLFLGAGRTGSFQYEGAGATPFSIPSAPLNLWTRNVLDGTMQCVEHIQGGYSIAWAPPPSPPDGAPIRQRQPSFPATITVKFRAPRPHVAISVDLFGDRFPLVLVRDENGRELEGELFNAQGILIWLAKQPYDDVRQISVTLLLQKPRVVTFVVEPPAVPPRPATKP